MNDMFDPNREAGRPVLDQQLPPDRPLPPNRPSMQPPRPPMMPPIPPQPMQPEQPLVATLTAQEWNVVMGALNELPMKLSRTIFDKLLHQLNNQG